MHLGYENLNFNPIGGLKPIIISLCLCSTLFACTSQILPRSQAPRNLSKDIDPVEIRSWQWKGKFVVKNEVAAEMGSLTWFKTGSDNFVSIGGPMGVGFRKFLVRHGKLQHLNLEETAEIHKVTEILGAELPLDKIPLWLLGRNNSSPHQPIKDGQNINTHAQNGWYITFKGWKKYQHALLPSEIIAKSKYTEVKLITLSWTPKIK